MSAGLERPLSKQKLNSFDQLRHFNKRVTNRLTMRFAGKRIYAVVHHTGRKSGKAYHTPVVAVQSDSSFIFPLPYSEQADWCRNIMAAQECEMDWHRRCYRMQNPQLIQPQQALLAFPRWLWPLLRHTQIYLKMDISGAPLLPAEQTLRKILVYGAGVLGSLYAGKLHQAGYQVTLLARGQRLQELREKGLVLVEDGSEKEDLIPIPVTDQLKPEEANDLVLVIVRKNQLPDVLPALAANSCTPNVLFLVNNAEGPGRLIEALGRERVLLGFPGAGGQRSSGIVHYRLASGKTQPTTIGEIHGSKSIRLQQIYHVLTDAGFPVAISENMEAWLKTHVALVSPLANAVYLAGGSNYRLARTRDGMVLLVRAVKEGLKVLRTLRIPITPGKYRILEWLPEPLLVNFLQKRFGSPQVELMVARHANAARDEMQTLAEEFRLLAQKSGVATPAMDTLFTYLDPDQPTVPDGAATIPVDWRSTIAWTGAVASAGLLVGWLLIRPGKGRKANS